MDAPGEQRRLRVVTRALSSGAVINLPAPNERSVRLRTHAGAGAARPPEPPAFPGHNPGRYPTSCLRRVSWRAIEPIARPLVRRRTEVKTHKAHYDTLRIGGDEPFERPSSSRRGV